MLCPYGVLATALTRTRKEEKKIPKIVATTSAAAKPPAQRPLGPMINFCGMPLITNFRSRRWGSSLPCHATLQLSPPINMSGNFPVNVSAESPSNISPNCLELMSKVSENFKKFKKKSKKPKKMI